MFGLGFPAADAQEATLCPLTDDQSNCVRVLACIGTEGRWFHGRAFGRGEGSLAGEINDGTTCTGAWTSRNRFGLGQANVECDDGMSAAVFYTYQHEYTGTAIGAGVSKDGIAIKTWTGLNVLDYLEGATGKVNVLPCGRPGDPADIPMG